MVTAAVAEVAQLVRVCKSTGRNEIPRGDILRGRGGDDRLGGGLDDDDLNGGTDRAGEPYFAAPPPREAPPPPPTPRWGRPADHGHGHHHDRPDA